MPNVHVKMCGFDDWSTRECLQHPREYYSAQNSQPLAELTRSTKGEPASDQGSNAVVPLVSAVVAVLNMPLTMIEEPS